MVSKCANPQCATPFRYFRDGRLIPVPETPNHDNHCARSTGVEWFWLCRECASQFTLIVDAELGVACVAKHPVVSHNRMIDRNSWLRKDEDAVECELAS